MLEEEIVGRYYFTKGEIASSVMHDNDVKEAMALLKSPDKYKAYLKAD